MKQVDYREVLRLNHLNYSQNKISDIVKKPARLCHLHGDNLPPCRNKLATLPDHPPPAILPL